MRKALSILAVVLVGLAGCDDSPSDPGESQLFVIDVEGQTFRIRANDAATIAALEARMATGTEGVISGELAAGDGGFNEPWSWHLVPSTIEVPDAAIELCDGTPSMVQDSLDYWLNTVERFCPWGAEVVDSES